MQDITKVTKHIKNKKVIVVGDFFLDRYTYIDDSQTGTSLYTGKSAYSIDHIETSPGAAGTIAKNFALLGVGDVYAVGFCGNDGDGYTLLQNLKTLQIHTDGMLVFEERLTPSYTMIMRNSGNGYIEESEVSVQNHKLTTPEIEQALIHNIKSLIKKVHPDAIIFLDQLDSENYGVITNAMRGFINEIHSSFPYILTYVDSRQFIKEFSNTIIRKCNNFEFVRAYSADQSKIPALCENLSAASDIPLIVTLGADGTLLSKNGSTIMIPAFTVNGNIDTRGAGDAFSTGYIAAKICGVSEYGSVIIGNAAAACCVSQIASTGKIKIPILRNVLKSCAPQINPYGGSL